MDKSPEIVLYFKEVWSIFNWNYALTCFQGL